MDLLNINGSNEKVPRIEKEVSLLYRWGPILETERSRP